MNYLFDVAFTASIWCPSKRLTKFLIHLTCAGVNPMISIEAMAWMLMTGLAKLIESER